MKLGKQYLCAWIVPALALSIAPALRADVTLRYETEFKPAAALQPMMEQAMKAMQAGAGSATTIRMKGNQGYTTAGNWIEIFDFVKGEVTLVDPAHKTFAALPVSQLADKMAGAMPQTQPQGMQALQHILESIKTNVDSKVTGKTTEIQGVQAEEREVTFTMDIPMPPGMVKQTGPDMNVKIVMHIWTAKKEEALRVPAIRELTGYQAWQRYIMNPAGLFEKLTGKMPGLSNAIGPFLEEMSKNQSVVLRTHMEIYMPFLATLAKQASAQGQSFPAIDPDAPLMEMNQEVAELSSAPVDASLFEIPKDYSPVTVEDMVAGMIKAQSAAAAAAPKAADPK
jgi:hypothetical protein